MSRVNDSAAFKRALDRAIVNVRGQIRDIATIAQLEVQRSVVEGSTLTGAPGQPVDTGNLFASWISERVSDTRWELSTNAEYALAVEDGVQAPYTTKSGASVTPKPMDFAGAAQRRTERAKPRKVRNRKGVDVPIPTGRVGGAHSVKATVLAWSRIVAHARSLVQFDRNGVRRDLID